MAAVRVGLITTLNWNIGDDFIRDGIVQVLSHVYEGHELQLLAVNKAVPFTVYPYGHPLRWLQALDRLPRGRRIEKKIKNEVSRVLHRLGGSRFDRAELIVQCGAPVIWPGCHASGWALPLWDQVVGRLSDRVAVLNLAAGSAYPWEAQPTAVTDERDSDFLRRILGYCRLTTTRDELASRLAGSLGSTVPTIPCSALLVGRRFEVPSLSDDGTVLFNYMPGGGHFDWGQGIDEREWMATAKLLVERLSRRHRVAFLCHDRNEYAAAEALNPNLPRFLPTTIAEYFSLIARSKASVCNRLHAAVALAGVGIPSVSVGTDTRLLMVAAIGLPYRYVKNARVDQLEDELETLMTNREGERERLLGLRDWTWNRYVDEVTEAIGG